MTATWDETFGLLLRIHAGLVEREKNKITFDAEKAFLLSYAPFPAACCSAGPAWNRVLPSTFFDAPDTCR